MQKSDQSHIDDLFKNHFDTFEVPVVDREGLWRKIAGKDNSRRMLLWLFCGIGVASLAWVVTAEVDFNNKTDQTRNEVSNLEAVEIQKSNDARVKTLVSIIEDAEEKETERKSVNEVDNQESVEVIESSEGVEGTNDDGSKKSENKRTERHIDQQNTNEKVIEEGISSEVGEHQVGLQSVKDDVIEEASKSKVELGSFTALERMQGVEMKDAIEGKIKIAKAASESQTSRVISTLENSINALTTSRPGLNDKFKSKLVCSTNGVDGINGHLFLDLYSGISISMDQVNLNSGFEDELAYRDAWKDRYTTLPSLSAGLAIGYETDKGMSLSGGLEYQRLESQYRTTQTVTEIIMVYDPMAYFYYDANNQIVWVADSVTAISRYDRTVSLGSKTHLLSVPLQLTIPIVSKAGWHIKALVGGAINFAMTHRGHHLRDDLVVDPITSSNVRTYMNESIGISIDGGLHVGKFLSERLELYLSPRYRYNRTSYLNSAEHLSVSRGFLGFRLGARYHLD